MVSLLRTDLFESCDLLGLLSSHLLLALVVLIGTRQLLSEHLHVALDFLRDATLTINLDIERAQVVQLDQLLLYRPLILQGRREYGRFDRVSGTNSGDLLPRAKAINRDGTLPLGNATALLLGVGHGTGRSFELGALLLLDNFLALGRVVFDGV